jgi:hypothetical protein
MVIPALTALAAPVSFIYQKPLLENPTAAARLYIYDPVTNSDRNITWEILSGLLLPAAPTWADITDKPGTFPPEAHSQAISTITGLQTALDGKESTLGFTPVNTTDARLSDARTPLAHNQDALTITGLATVATSGSYPDLVNTPPFTRGYDGREIELQTTATHVQWRYAGTTPWADLVPLYMITGAKGTDGKTYTCFITAGLSTITYDKNGSNPAPTVVAYGAEMREDGSVVTPTCSWTVPASGSLLSGSSNACTFTPTVAGTWIAGSADNRVNLSATYAGVTCNAVAPVAVTKIGSDGLPADPENKQMLYSRIGVATTGDVLNTQAGSGDADNFAFRTVRAKGGDIHRSDLAVGQTWIHARPSDTATTPKFGIKSSGGTPLATFAADGAFAAPQATINAVNGMTANALTVNKTFPGYGVPLVNAWAERFSAIRTDDTVSVSVGKTYTETLTIFADGTITAASINFYTPNGSHIVPAYVTGSQSNGYTIVATYTTVSGDTSIRMPDISYLAGTATTISITAASLIEQKTNLIIDATALSGIYSYTGAHNSASIAQSDGSYRMNRINAWGEETVAVRRDITRAISPGTSYTAEIVFRHDGTSTTNQYQWLYGLTPSGARQDGGSATVTSLGNGFSKLTATRTTGADVASIFRFPEWNVYGATTGTLTYYDFISTKLTLDSESQPATTNLYSGSWDDLYHYTPAHTTTATPQTGSTIKLTISADGALMIY